MMHCLFHGSTAPQDGNYHHESVSLWLLLTMTPWTSSCMEMLFSDCKFCSQHSNEFTLFLALLRRLTMLSQKGQVSRESDCERLLLLPECCMLLAALPIAFFLLIVHKLLPKDPTKFSADRCDLMQELMQAVNQTNSCWQQNFGLCSVFSAIGLCDNLMILCMALFCCPLWELTLVTELDGCWDFCMVCRCVTTDKHATQHSTDRTANNDTMEQAATMWQWFMCVNTMTKLKSKQQKGDFTCWQHVKKIWNKLLVTTKETKVWLLTQSSHSWLLKCEAFHNVEKDKVVFGSLTEKWTTLVRKEFENLFCQESITLRRRSRFTLGEWEVNKGRARITDAILKKSFVLVSLFFFF